jgi:hypothetical protein
MNKAIGQYWQYTVRSDFDISDFRLQEFGVLGL